MNTNTKAHVVFHRIGKIDVVLDLKQHRIGKIDVVLDLKQHRMAK
jgi:hypothetical protein